jgi:hypothetical protein
MIGQDDCAFGAMMSLRPRLKSRKLRFQMIAETLLAVAVFGVLLGNVFESGVDQRLKSFDVSPEARIQIYAQRARLAAAETGDRAGRQAVEQAFYHGLSLRIVGRSWLGSSKRLYGLVTDNRRPPPPN